MIDVDTRVEMIRDPKHPCWGEPGWPEFVTGFRDHQWNAFVEIKEAYERGADVVLLNAPVGSGKTIIAEMVRRWQAQRALYVCSGKSLQDQFMADFPYAKLLKGRSNYPTYDHPELFNQRWDSLSAADCTMERIELPAPGCSKCPPAQAETDVDEEGNPRRHPHCEDCHPVERCPYRVAKASALGSPLAVLNTSYMLYEANLVGLFSKMPFVIVDECDMLEGELMSFEEVTISKRAQAKWGIDMPDRKTEQAGMRERDNGSTYWLDWVEATREVLDEHIRALPRQNKSRQDRRDEDYLRGLFGKLNNLGPALDEGGWVYTGYERGDITFKPVMVDGVGNDRLWAHGRKWLLMSGTILDPKQYIESLGLPETKKWAVVDVPMTFPKENRPIKVLPITEVTAKNKDESWPKLASTCAELAERHPDERILIHTVSYKLTEYIAERMPNERVVTYDSGRDRDDALKRYLDKPNGILVAPSMDRGVDLPGDACRVQIVCKLPFPYLGDKQVSARLYGTPGGQTWYLIQCVRSFVQMTGRGVRNKDDYAITYVLDKAFQNNIMKRGKKLVPKYMNEAIDWSGRLD